MSLLLTCLIGFGIAPALTQAPKASTPPADYLDFWVGDWNASWDEPGGKKGTGRNRISKVMDGKVVHERFEILSGANKGFKGESWSAIDATVGRWRQTWVDNSGGYIALDALSTGGDKGFSRTFKNPQGEDVTQRMRFTKITKNDFVWIWEGSKDGGKTWTQNWKIDYKRR